MGNTERSKALRKARNRALARLREKYETEYNDLLDEELARLGEDPRTTVREYAGRTNWQSEQSA